MGAVQARKDGQLLHDTSTHLASQLHLLRAILTAKQSVVVEWRFLALVGNND